MIDYPILSQNNFYMMELRNWKCGAREMDIAQYPFCWHCVGLKRWPLPHFLPLPSQELLVADFLPFISGVISSFIILFGHHLWFPFFHYSPVMSFFLRWSRKLVWKTCVIVKPLQFTSRLSLVWLVINHKSLLDTLSMAVSWPQHWQESSWWSKEMYGWNHCNG